MQIGKIVSAIGNTFNSKNSNSKQDLTSFGVSDNQNMISKNSAQALKNKYGANVSFDGFHKTVNVTEEGEDVVTSRLYLYGSNGNVYFTRTSYSGSSECGVGFIGVEEQKKWVRDKFSAKIDGSANEGIDNDSHDRAIKNAIVNSPDFKDGSTIIEVRKPNMYSHKARADVYFSDDYETVSRSVVNDTSVNYIVKAPRASIQEPPQPQRKKSFLERLFG